MSKRDRYTAAMRIAPACTVLFLMLFCIPFHAEEPPQKITVTGTLSRAMAIGAESTGWIIQLDSEDTIDGKPLSSIEVSDPHKPERLDKLANKRVKVIGKLRHRQGIETGEQPYIEISSIKEDAAAVQPGQARTPLFNVSGSEWVLEDLGGRGVIDNVQATVAFPETGKVTGNGSCNRFFGPAEIAGDTIKVGPLGSTRMACPEAVMNQETTFLQALQAAERFEWKDPNLLIYCKGLEKPLRFTRMTPSSSATDEWMGRWEGPEGTYLLLSKNGAEYLVVIKDLDGSKTFAGFQDGNRIRFTREGKTEFLSAGDGPATGMKWLAEKRNCLLTGPGEGWCRN